MSTAGVHDARRSYTLVGGFVMLMLALLILWIALLSGRTGSTDTYEIGYANVMGLSDGAPVSFEGYRIGKVERIRPGVPGENEEAGEDGDAHAFVVEISVEQGWRIPEDSIARMVASGLLSAVAVDISSGQSTTALKPGARVDSRERADVFAVVSDAAAQMAELVRDLEPLMTELMDGAPEIVSNVRVLTESLNETADQLGELVSDENAARVGTILAELEDASRSSATLAREFRKTRADLDALLSQMDDTVGENRADLRRTAMDLRNTTSALARGADAVSNNLVTASQNLSEFSDDIRRDPSVLIRGRSDGDED